MSSHLSVHLNLILSPSLRIGDAQNDKLARSYRNSVTILYVPLARSQLPTDLRSVASVEKAEYLASGIYMSDLLHSRICDPFSHQLSAGSSLILSTSTGECVQAEFLGNGL